MPIESVGETPEAQDQSQQESNAPVTETGTSDQGFGSPFSINDVPEEFREHVERYNKQLQGAYTSKTQELADQRKQYEAHQADLDFVSSLRENPEIQLAVFRELAGVLEYDLDDEDPAQGDDQEAEQVFEDPRLTELLAHLDQEKAQEQQVAHLNSVAGQIAEGVQAAEKEFGRELSDHEQTLFLQSAMSRTLEDGSPDVEGAKQFMRALETDFQTRWIDSKKSAHQVGAGMAGSHKPDLSDDATRRQHMLGLIEASASVT